MSGIAGLLYKQNRDVTRDEMNSFINLLSRRGPDGSGYFIDRGLGLAHTLVSKTGKHIDSSPPTGYAKNRFKIVIDGQIYNCPEIREELESLGFEFETDEDSEVVLAAYVHWGASSLAKLNGSWALAIWDSSDQILFLARDRFGKKPLYYWYNSEAFAFGSEMKCFLGLPFFDATLDNKNIGTILKTKSQLGSSDLCLFKNLSRLEPATCLEVQISGEMKQQRWWNTLDNLSKLPTDFEAQIKIFKALLFDACRIRSQGNMPVGLTLSGGLDSSSILYIMRILQESGQISNFEQSGLSKIMVACFPGCMNDETDIATRTSKETGQGTIFLEIDPLEAISNFERAIFDTECLDSHITSYWLTYRELRRASITTSISGLGGDELLAGYPWHAQAARMDALVWPCDNTNKQVQLKETTEALFQDGLWPEFSPGFDDNWVRATNSSLTFKNFESDRFALSGMNGLHRQLYFDFHYGVLSSHLATLDNCAAAHGIELRAPFMDWRLVCLCFSLPSDALISDGHTKNILRRAMTGIVPSEILNQRRKIGFSSPLEEWSAGPFKALIMDTVNSQNFLESEISNGPKIRDYVQHCYSQHDSAGIIHVWNHIQAHYLKNIFSKSKWRDFTLASLP